MIKTLSGIFGAGIESKSLKIKLKIFRKSNGFQLFVFNKSNKGPPQDTCLQIIKNYFEA